MKASRNAVANGNLEAVRKRFENWRKSRGRVGPIPDKLWGAAINAARSAGVNRTASDLHLDAGKLKRLLLAADKRTSRPARTPRFVELITPLPAVTPECVIEFESDSGGKMRVHWKSSAAPDWTSLLRAWRDIER